MKESNSSITGGSNGSLAGASTSDLKRGYTDASPESEKMKDADMVSPFEKPAGGFAGRPSGWER